MKKQLALFLGLAAIITLLPIYSQLTRKVASIQSLASQFAANVEYPQFDVKTAEGLNMDCLKAIKIRGTKLISVFHSSIQQKQSGYSALYLAEFKTEFLSSNWTKIIKLSERGSQGYLYQVSGNALLVLYQLQNHENGNTVAIRYYQSYERLQVNNFLYEYQLEQKIDKLNIRNIGTPSVQNITLLKAETDPRLNRYNLTIKFHYSPDGKKDLPGYGYVTLYPTRDFVDSEGHWIGGCKQKYSDWKGSTDTKVQQAIARVRPYSKIGQRDLFLLTENGLTSKYYLYEVNMNTSFDWKDWRIVLYSEKDNRAVQIAFSFGQDQDLANPHISLLSYDKERNAYTFFISFFLPSEGVKPDPDVRAGEMTAIITITP